MKIIYPQDDNTVAVMAVNPAILENMTLAEAGVRFVPTGKPFKIVNDADIPQDETFWAAWRVDFTQNDGTGGAR